MILPNETLITDGYLDQLIEKASYSKIIMNVNLRNIFDF